MDVTLVRNGNSASVTLPVAMRRRNGMNIGDKLSLSEVAPGEILISKRGGFSAVDAVASLNSFIESLPMTPWDGDCSPEDDRRLLAARYE